jgi:hypothetical protein
MISLPKKGEGFNTVPYPIYPRLAPTPKQCPISELNCIAPKHFEEINALK